MDRRAELWVIGGCLVAAFAFIGLIVLLGKGAASTNTPGSFTATYVPAVTASDWTRGASSTTVVSLVEYGDFECPACGAYEPILESLQKEYAGKVLFVFRNFPLYQIHPNAMISAQAAEAAGQQGKYWEMHDLLYQKQSEWAQDLPSEVVAKHFDGYAQSLGLNVDTFNADINSSEVMAKIQRDLASGNAAKIDHTPTFFVDLAQIQNPNSLKDFENALNTALASSTVRS